MGLDRHVFAGLLALLALIFLVSCSGSGPKPPILVAVSAPASQTDQGLTIAITSTVANDPSGQGVKWSLTGAGSLSSQGILSVSYNAPPQSNITTAQSATVTATVSVRSVQIGVATNQCESVAGS